jgi:Protein of unknown function (DUF1638).
VSAPEVGLIACGALASDLRELQAERQWDVAIYPLPPLLHNHPEQIAVAVEELLDRHTARHRTWAIGYADCGTYGALDEVCERRGLRRLAGDHCYDLYAGREQIAELMAAEPGTYLLTDFLVQGFHRSVIVELGLDRYPQLREDYFGNYRQVVWLTGRGVDPARRAELATAAQQAADALGLPLVTRPVGRENLAAEVESLLP